MSTKNGPPAAAAAPAAADEELPPEEEMPVGKSKSRRLRSCMSNMEMFWAGLIEVCLPPPPPPPLKNTRKDRAVLATAKQADNIRKRLYKSGINLKDANISHLSDERLIDFNRKLDDNKKRIYVKAAKVATHTAFKLLDEFRQPVAAQVQLPWGLKRGHTIPVTCRLIPEDPPYDPSDPTPKLGFLKMVVEQEGGMFGADQKVVFVSGVLCYSGNDNTVTVKTLENVGNILIINNDEASRWRWFCAINAGLHRIAAAKVMLDQPSAIVPWHDKAIVEQELES